MNLANLFELFSELIGGLGIFLFGMKSMSDGMQAVAGSSLRRMISAVTNNRYMAAVVGTIVTCIVQSSSITTVMVVGFVNSQVMTLTQAVGVIMGANIGTTITGWILVLKVGKYGLPILGSAAIIYLFSKSDRRRFWALAIMGIGMVFFGLELMKDACAIIKNNPDFELWFQRFQADSYFGVLKCAMVGCLLTMLVQSSSATLGITISLATQGIIGYPTAAALVLGENIGTTITAFLASIGATTNARRAAYFHVIFNILGVIWITAIFQWYIQFIQWLVGIDGQTAILSEGAVVEEGTTAAIAATHSVFNILNTILFLPLAPMLVRLLTRIVPQKDFKEKPKLTDLDIRMLETPLLAIERSQHEIQKMAEGNIKMLDWLLQLRESDQPDKALANRLKHREKVLDSVQDEIAEFVTDLLSGNVPHSVADEARCQLRLADEYESVSDYVNDLDNFDRKLRRDGFRFLPTQLEELNSLHLNLRHYLSDVNTALVQKNRNVLKSTDPSFGRIKKQIKQLRRRHLEELSHGTIPPLVSVAYLASLNAYGRVLDHTYNIAETIAGEK